MRPAQDLDLEEDPGFQQWDWRLQRLGWALICLLVLAAVLGLLGTGPLSRGRVENDFLRVDYFRFAQRDARTPMEITYRGKAGDTSLVLEFDRHCMADLDLEGTRPNPKGEMARTGEGMSLEFDLAPGAEWTTLHFLFRPASAGLRHCRITADGLGTLELGQFAFP